MIPERRSGATLLVARLAGVSLTVFRDNSLTLDCVCSRPMLPVMYAVVVYEHVLKLLHFAKDCTLWKH